MMPGELEEARAEAARRAAKRIPPGYMDAGKAEGDPAGDYLIWRQLMTEAKTRRLPVVFITDDTKEDWYRTDQNIPLGARYELREEMMREAGVLLLMITTKTFIDYAKKYLNAEFSEETADHAAELPSAGRRDSPSTAHSPIADALLDRIATRARLSNSELRYVMQLLHAELGKSEMVQGVMRAVITGQAAGALGPEDASTALNALVIEINGGSDTSYFHPSANSGLTVLRDAFESALQVSPGHDAPDRVARASMTIAMNLERLGVTPDDIDRGRAWLQEHARLTEAERSESQDEPPPQNPDPRSDP
jgi:hypothetical protein